MQRILITCLGCASLYLAAAATRASGAQAEPAWTRPHRHFSFSGIVFDLDNGIWAQGWRGEALADCSNDQMHCLASQTFGIAVPRRCADLAANHWAIGNVRTELLLRHVDSAPPPHGGGSQTTLFLGNSDRPSLLFVYDLNLGLTALYWDAGGRIDFIAMAREGNLDEWLFGESNREGRQPIYFPRTTFEPVGACQR